MKYHKQLIEHDPINGKYGDCYRTCIACLLNVHPNDIPHIYNYDHTKLDEDTYIKTRTANWHFLQKYLIAMHGVSIATCFFKTNSLKNILNTIRNSHEYCTVILGGVNKNGVGHVVLVNKNGIIHDTSGNGISGPITEGEYAGHYSVEVLVSFVGEYDNNYADDCINNGFLTVDQLYKEILEQNLYRLNADT